MLTPTRTTHEFRARVRAWVAFCLRLSIGGRGGIGSTHCVMLSCMFSNMPALLRSPSGISGAAGPYGFWTPTHNQPQAKDFPPHLLQTVRPHNARPSSPFRNHKHKSAPRSYLESDDFLARRDHICGQKHTQVKRSNSHANGVRNPMNLVFEVQKHFKRFFKRYLRGCELRCGCWRSLLRWLSTRSKEAWHGGHALSQTGTPEIATVDRGEVLQSGMLMISYVMAFARDEGV